MSSETEWPPLVDKFGRVHRDMRISLTDRCSLRCTYCMPAEGVPWLAGTSMLSADEMVRAATIAVQLGITKIRLTGGEPLLHPDVVSIVSRLTPLSGPSGPVEVSLTTNGLRLPALAAPLKDAGLSRVNISIDTLDRERYQAITRRDRLTDVIAGMAAADAAGLHPVKLNAVAMRGINDHEVVNLVTFALDHGYHMRFIEQMPLDPGHTWDRTQMVTQEEILDSLREVYELTPEPGRGAMPAENFLINGGPAKVGIIASVTAPFCGACDRLRLTADGQLRACLFSETETDVRNLLRANADDATLAEAFRTCIAGKKAGHGIGEPTFVQPSRPMSAIGG